MSKTGSLAVASFVVAALGCSPAISAESYAFDEHPAQTRYTGTTHLPDFRGRDRGSALYRTRIRSALARGGANFDGRYSVVTIGCGTDCSFGYVIDVSTGKVRDLPRGGEEFMDLRFAYRLDSNLMIARWRSLATGRCYDETFVWRDERFIEHGKKDVGDIDFCLRAWPVLVQNS